MAKTANTSTLALAGNEYHHGSALIASEASARKTIAALAIRSWRDGFGSKLMAGADRIDDCGLISVVGPTTAHHPVPDIGVLRFQQGGERGLLFDWGAGMALG